MFASDEAGRAVALGVGLSVLCHVVAAWTVAQYVATGESRQLDLRPRGLSEEPTELLGTFAPPERGHPGRALKRTSGVGEAAGEPSGGSGATASNSERTEDDSPGDDTEATAESTDPSDGNSAASPERRAAGGGGSASESEPPEKSRASPSEATDSPSDPRETPSATAETETPRSEKAPARPETGHTSAETESEDSTGSERSDSEGADGERPSPSGPSFPSIEGGEGEGDSPGPGEGEGTRGGVSVGLIEEVIRTHRDEILECYATRHDYISDGTKSVIVEFWIGTDGLIERIRTVHRTTNSRVADCMKERMTDWQFPELDEKTSFVKKYSIDARMEANWIQPRPPDPER